MVALAAEEVWRTDDPTARGGDFDDAHEYAHPLLRLSLVERAGHDPVAADFEWGLGTLGRLHRARAQGIATHQVESALACLRQLGVVLDNLRALRDYLTEHLGMIDGTLRAAHLALACFGSSATFHLHAHQSPESEDDEYLVLLIRQPVYDDDILERIEAIWAGHDDLLATASGWLLVTTDFRPPQ